jgi:methyl acetate hydrolase
MSPGRQNRLEEELIRAILDKAVSDGVTAGAVAAVTTGDETVFAVASGLQGKDQTTPMSIDSVFWIDSMTKAITTVAALHLVESGKLSLDGPIDAVLPALSEPSVLIGFSADGAPVTRPARAPITLRHLLSHTAGFSYDFSSADIARYLETTGTPSARTGRLLGLRQPLLFDPGERWEYGINVDWAGQAVEAASGLRLDAYLAAHVTGPLGMNDTVFFLRPDQMSRQVSLHCRERDGGLLAVKFAAPPAPEFLAGGGGLRSTAPDYLAFMRMILNHGMAGRTPILKPQSIAAMASNQIGASRAGKIGTANPALAADFNVYPGMDAKFGLGFLLNPEPGPDGRSAGSLTWAGLPNCHYWIDPSKNLAALILMQLLPFGDAAAMTLYSDFERAVYA